MLKFNILRTVAVLKLFFRETRGITRGAFFRNVGITAEMRRALRVHTEIQNADIYKLNDSALAGFPPRGRVFTLLTAVLPLILAAGSDRPVTPPVPRIIYRRVAPLSPLAVFGFYRRRAFAVFSRCVMPPHRAATLQLRAEGRERITRPCLRCPPRCYDAQPRGHGAPPCDAPPHLPLPFRTG